MDAHEFVARADAVVERLAGRIDAQQAQFVREDAEAGSWENALSNLVAALRKAGVEVSRGDRDDLRELLADIGESTEDVDRLNVAEPGSG